MAETQGNCVRAGKMLDAWLNPKWKSSRALVSDSPRFVRALTLLFQVTTGVTFLSEVRKYGGTNFSHFWTGNGDF